MATGYVCRCGHEHAISELEDAECFVCGADIEDAHNKARFAIEEAAVEACAATEARRMED